MTLEATLAAGQPGVLGRAPSLVIGLAVLAYLLVRQRQVRPVSPRAQLVFPIALMLLGASDISGYLQSRLPSPGQIGVLALSVVVLGAGLGAWRAWSVRLWWQQSQLLRQGTWLTMALWVVSVGLHLLIEGAAGIGSASLLLYLGVTLVVQRLVFQARAKRLSGAGT